MDRKKHGESFAKSVYYPRILGTLCCSPIILQSLLANDSNTYLYYALFLNVLIWPHVAYKISKAANQPFIAEKRNLN
ncbi:diguanylate cyclase AdrA, partial [Corynebacterium pseudodiphtheriticum]